MKRGDIIIVAPAGEFGKPRPAVIVQSNLALPSATITYLMITSDLERQPLLRIPVEPGPGNGLVKSSEIMVDLIMTSARSRIRQVIGSLDAETMSQVDDAMLVFLDLSRVV